MKKNLLIGAVLLGAASFSMLTGFDSALTAQDVVAKCQEASLSTNEANAQAVINLDADFAVPAAEIVLGIKSAGTEKVAFTLDPLAMAAEAQITASAMGQDFGVDVSVYGITEDDGQFAVYTKEDMGDGNAEWTKTTSDASQLTEMIEKLKANPVALPFDFTLAPEPIDLNGNEGYELSTTISWNDLYLLIKPYLEEAAGADASAQLDIYSTLLSGLKFNVVAYVNAETFKVEFCHIDLGQTDWTTIAALLSSLFGTDENGDAYQVTLTVNASDIDIVYYYATPVEIVLPEEAASAQVMDVDAGSLLEMVENAEADVAADAN